MTLDGMGRQEQVSSQSREKDAIIQQLLGPRCECGGLRLRVQDLGLRTSIGVCFGQFSKLGSF